MAGKLIGIYVAAGAGEAMREIGEAEFVASKGILGDRYHAGVGEFSPEVQDPDHELTLIESEQVERFNAESGLAFEAGDFRRNLVTRGVSLTDLVGVEFRVGEVVARGVRFCEPCAYLAERTDPRIVKGLLGRCGLRAGIVRGGTVRSGDAVGA